jgi:hypothetical protein
MSSNPPVAKEISSTEESVPVVAAVPQGVSINADPIAANQDIGLCRGCGREFQRYFSYTYIYTHMHSYI